MKIFLLLIFSLIFVSFVSVAAAQENQEIAIIALVQIIQRDDNGNLIAYLEYNKAHIPDRAVFFHMLSLNEPIKIIEDINGKRFELIQIPTEVQTDESGLMSTVKVGLEGSDGILYPGSVVAHDGMRVPPGEFVTVVWTFLKPV